MKIKTGIFNIISTEVTPEKGSLLVSEPLLAEAYFQRSVVFLIEHNSGGTMGLVLNKPSGLILNRLVEGLDAVNEIPVYYGGPMSSDRLYYLHTLGHLIPESVEVAHGLYIGGDFDVILSYLRSGNNIEQNIKFLAGYSGWDVGQLAQEINNKVWAVGNVVSVTDCITQEGDLFWRSTVESLGEKFRPWLHYPKMPYLN